jgi:hypothetical protein
MSCGFKLLASPVTTAPPATRPLSAPASAAPLGPPGQTAGAPATTASSAQPIASPAVGQMGSMGTVPVSIWGPFAGYGTRGRHVSWLINDQGERADALRDAATARFERREIPRATIQRVTLLRQGILVDSRPYFLIRRGLATAGLYIARFGQDLYVSQITYFKGPISSVRVLIVVAMILFALIYPTVLNDSASQIGFNVLGGVSGSMGTLFTLVCCLGPIYLLDYLALSLLAIFSAYKWLTEKDLLAALRVPPNDFDTDDIVALEKSVEQTVREALDVVGIEQRLMPQAAEYGMRRRLI